MKNHAQEEYYSVTSQSKQAIHQQDVEQRIQFYKKAWQDGTLDINAARLAQRIIDFETDVESALSDTTVLTNPAKRTSLGKSPGK